MSLSTLLLWIRFLGHTTLLLKGNRHSSCLCLVSVPCQPTELFSQSHPSTETRENPHSRHDPHCFPHSPIVYSAPKFRTEWSCAARNTLLHWPVSVCDQQIAVSLVCPVSGVVFGHPQKPRAGILSPVVE